MLAGKSKDRKLGFKINKNSEAWGLSEDVDSN